MKPPELSKGIAKLYGAVTEPIQPTGTIDNKLNDIIQRLERIECSLRQVSGHHPSAHSLELKRKYDDAVMRSKKSLRKCRA